MLKIIKKVLVGSLSILGISTLIWVILLTNPGLSYAESTTFDQVEIFHNDPLASKTEDVILHAIEIIKTSDIYDENLNIQLCLNDKMFYPELHPMPGGSAYAFLNKTVIYACKPDFEKNEAEFSWEINNYELRKFNLTYLLAHEFVHNLQHNFNARYVVKNTFGKLDWKLEGYADYIARQFKDDGQLKDKIEIYLTEEKKEHNGIPVFKLEDGTIQNLSYFQYAIVIQYLMEVKKLDFQQILDLDPSIDKPFSEMLEWNAE